MEGTHFLGCSWEVNLVLAFTIKLTCECSLLLLDLHNSGSHELSSKLLDVFLDADLPIVVVLAQASFACKWNSHLHANEGPFACKWNAHLHANGGSFAWLTCMDHLHVSSDIELSNIDSIIMSSGWSSWEIVWQIFKPCNVIFFYNHFKYKSV